MYDVSAWSLSALIHLLPEYIDIEQRYELDITIHNGMYSIMYKDNYTSISYYVTEYTDIFEAIIAMLEKLKLETKK
jgi:hypothetical protein